MFDTNAVRERLKSIGCEAGEEDEALMVFCIEKVRNTIRNETNQKEVPEGLEYIAVDMACGEFLLSKKTFAPDDLKNLDLDFAVKQIQKGDTNTVFAVGEGSHTPEQRLDAFINHILNDGKSEFSRYRRFAW